MSTFIYLVCIATLSASPYIAQKNFNAGQMSFYSHLMLNANKNVRCIQEKFKGDDKSPL